MKDHYQKGPVFGQTHPFAEVDGGWWIAHTDDCCGVRNEVYNSNSNMDSGRPFDVGKFQLGGNILVLVHFPTGSRNKVTTDITAYMCSYDIVSKKISCGFKKTKGWMLNQDYNDNVLTPADSYEIDRKMDDGSPISGIIEPYGASSACYKYDSKTQKYSYDTLNGTKACGLYVRLKQ